MFCKLSNVWSMNLIFMTIWNSFWILGHLVGLCSFHILSYNISVTISLYFTTSTHSRLVEISHNISSIIDCVSFFSLSSRFFVSHTSSKSLWLNRCGTFTALESEIVSSLYHARLLDTTVSPSFLLQHTHRRQISIVFQGLVNVHHYYNTFNATAISTLLLCALSTPPSLYTFCHPGNGHYKALVYLLQSMNLHKSSALWLTSLVHLYRTTVEERQLEIKWFPNFISPYSKMITMPSSLICLQGVH